MTRTWKCISEGESKRIMNEKYNEGWSFRSLSKKYECNDIVWVLVMEK